MAFSIFKTELLTQFPKRLSQVSIFISNCCWVRNLPKGIISSGFRKLIPSSVQRLERDYASLIAQVPKRASELSDIGTDVEDEVHFVGR